MLESAVYWFNNFLRENEIFLQLQIFWPSGTKTFTVQSDLCGKVSRLQTYEHYIIGSLLPIYFYCDHRPSLHLSGRKRQLSHRFFRYHVTITNLQNMKIVWTSGSTLAFTDNLSRKELVDEYQIHQPRHMKEPTDIKIRNEHSSPVFYCFQHDDNPNDTFKDFANEETTKRFLDCTMMVSNFTLHNLSNEIPVTSIQPAADCFWTGGTINYFFDALACL